MGLATSIHVAAARSGAATDPKDPCYQVYAWDLKKLLYHASGTYVCTVALIGPFGDAPEFCAAGSRTFDDVGVSHAHEGICPQ